MGGGQRLKATEELEKEIETACDPRYSVDTYHAARSNGLLRIITEIQIEILKEIRSFRQTWQQQQEQQGKGRHK
jgi:hypothetical protein